MISLLDYFLEFPSVTIDSRTIIPGQIFFAIKGENFDGNRFVDQAIEKGVALCISSDPTFKGRDKVIVVEDTLVALQNLATEYRKTFRIPVLAITGSNGKTTTKELLAAVLNTRYKTHYTQGNLNNHLGVPLTILATPGDAEFLIVEMGANHIGEIKHLCEIAHPDYGAISNIGIAHLEGFGSPEGVKKAKSELFHYINKFGKKFFLNTEEISLSFLNDPTNPLIEEVNSTKTHLMLHQSPQDFLCLKYFEQIVGTHLVGNYNFNNVLLSIGIGKYFGCHEAEMITAIADYVPRNSRSQMIKYQEVDIILDAYNANPSSMLQAIDNLMNMPSRNKGIILGDMLELGQESEKYHRQILEKIRGVGDKLDLVVLIGPQFKGLSEGFQHFKYYNGIEEANKSFRLSDYRDYLVLIKGSRGMKLEQLIH
ncbi:MAG: UDP-N-acetylmuramoyl-tripeptide--D-alanyl-D-alanine ligase [Saprospiraceae bacterium]|nr:UDP-N-acetylmuramoyl-tripeptide--D-alanyl-D-alanine ligase [Saprospiraceae bacterium]